MKTVDIKPFDNCPALDGYHCQTNSLAKIFFHNGHPLSEDMLLGLGAGMGFIYWHMKGSLSSGISDFVFVGGRANNKDFFNDVGKRTGVKIKSISTASSKRAEISLLEKLHIKEPVMVFGDMGYLPWFDIPGDFHFGGHTFVVCGFDGEAMALASDMDQKASGLKKGFYYPVTLEQLSKARGSIHKPFPAKNTYLEFNFKDFRNPTSEDVISSIKQTIEFQLDPPIKNIGVKGMKYTAKEILKWPALYNDRELRMNLFNFYIFIEIGGTGGGCFRYMYSRFLNEAEQITGNRALAEASQMFHESGKKLTDIGLMFKDAETMQNMEENVKTASVKFNEVADLEEKAFVYLVENISY